MENKTVICGVLDSSGSIAEMLSNYVSGANEFFNSQNPKNNTKLKIGSETEFNILLFDSKLYWINDNFKSIDSYVNFNRETYYKGGMTCLHDAIGEAISTTEKYVSTKSQAPNVIIFIQTDGLENASSKYTSSELKKMITIKQSLSNPWEFIFIGSNQDAILKGSSFGIKRGKCLTYSDNSEECVTMTYKNVVKNVTEIRDCQQKGYSTEKIVFTNEQRHESLNKS